MLCEIYLCDEEVLENPILFYFFYFRNRYFRQTMDFNNEHILIAQLKEGNRKAFTFLIDLYHHKLCVYANSLIDNHIQAEDIVQNVFLSLWEKRERFDVSNSIQSFLYKAVYNEFIDQYRKTQTALRIEYIYIEYLNSLVIDSNSEDIEKLIARVKESINGLPPKCKQVFELSKKEGLTNIEISEYLNVGVKAVEANITRAFKILRTDLQNKIKLLLFVLFDLKLSRFSGKRIVGPHLDLQ